MQFPRPRGSLLFQVRILCGTLPVYHPTDALCRECQRADWKRGRNGRTHKQICGKALQESLRTEGGATSDETGDEEVSVVDIPSPAPGFRRSAALLHQITFLVQPPYVNYVVCGPFVPSTIS